MRDLTKVLDAAELVKLRAILAQHPDIIPDNALGSEYPKMLYHLDYLEMNGLVKDHPDPVVKKDASEQIRRCIVVVYNIEQEEEYLQEGWFSHPAEIAISLGLEDPRKPRGREAMLAGRQATQSRDQEIRDLRRRYAELTGRTIDHADDPGVPQERHTATAAVLAGVGGGTSLPKPDLAEVTPAVQALREKAAQKSGGKGGKGGKK